MVRSDHILFFVFRLRLIPTPTPVHLRIKLRWILRNFSEGGERPQSLLNIDTQSLELYRAKLPITCHPGRRAGIQRFVIKLFFYL